MHCVFHVEHAGHEGGEAHIATLLWEIARRAEKALDGCAAPGALAQDVACGRIDVQSSYIA
jgi:hypothetical protein